MDSVGRIVSSIQATAAHLALTIPSEQAVKDIIGLSLEPAIERLFGVLPMPQHHAFLQRYRDEYVDLNRTPTPLFPSAEAVITELKAQQHMLAVATGKARRGLDRVWQEVAIGRLFDASRCADETHGKPNPQMLYELMDQLSFKAEHTMMVGDSEHDVKMAKAAGVFAVGVDFGVHDHRRLEAAGADVVISDLLQLPAIVTKHIDMDGAKQ